MPKPTLAIAIDFGTTFSGLSYMPVGEGEQFSQLDNWPGATGKLYKVPTIVSYSYDDRSKRYSPWTFGFAAEAAPPAQRCSMFKVFLDVNDDTEKRNSNRHSVISANETPQKPTWEALGKTVDDVIRDFLQLLYNHMLDTFVDEGLKPEDINYNVLFTVPAQFELLEVEKFKSIVKSTGFGRHKVSVSLREPEAAVLYTIRHGVKSLMPIGQCIVLCDAGGGTVDIASYQVVQQLPAPKIEQVNIVTGRPCGSMNIDLAFKRFLFQECFGDHWRAFFQTANGMEHLHRMCKSFSDRKEAFTNEPSTPNITIQVSPPDLSGFNIIGGYLRVSREKMCEFFEESVKGTMECLDEHVRKCVDEGLSIKSIFLVGGLGSSRYLHKIVKEYAAKRTGGIEVIKPRDAEYAVVRGAIESHQQSLLGKGDLITVRICPASYGIRVNEVWDPRRHDPTFDQKFIHPVTGKCLATDQVDWLIKKGDKIHGTRVANRARIFHRTFEKMPEVWKDQVLMCMTDDPPSRMTDAVKPACILRSDLTRLPIEMFDKQKLAERTAFFRRRKSYYSCDFKVKLEVGVTDLKFELEFKDKVRSDALNISWGELVL